MPPIISTTASARVRTGPAKSATATNAAPSATIPPRDSVRRIPTRRNAMHPPRTNLAQGREDDEDEQDTLPEDQRRRQRGAAVGRPETRHQRPEEEEDEGIGEPGMAAQEHGHLALAGRNREQP